MAKRPSPRRPPTRPLAELIARGATLPWPCAAGQRFYCDGRSHWQEDRTGRGRWSGRAWKSGACTCRHRQ